MNSGHGRGVPFSTGPPARQSVGRVDTGVVFPAMAQSQAFDDNTTPQRDAAQLAAELRETQRRCRELERANAALQRASEAKAQLLAQLSHEIRTPLNAINGFAELLADPSYGPLTDRQRRFVAHIGEAGAHLLQLLNDVIDLSRFETGKMELDLRPVAVMRLVEQVARVLSGLARDKGITIRVQPDQPDVVAFADEQRARQVLLNLLSNAIKYSPEGTEVDVNVSSEGGHVRVDVRDRGIGIAPKDQERIFEEFVRLNEAEEHPGAGLGLALSRELVQAHGGEIGVDSAPGQGSTFWFTLPLATPPDDGEAARIPRVEGACTCE